MKLTEQEKRRLLQASLHEPRVATRPPKPRPLSPAEYALRVEQFGRLFPRPKKPVSFTGDHWLL